MAKKNMTKHSAEVIAVLQVLAVAGELKPKRVVEEARDPGSPLHRHFEWDDDVAAQAHREEQARTLIRSVRYEVVVHERVLQIPFYTHDTDADGQGYVELRTLKHGSEQAFNTLAEEMARVRGALTRAKSVAIGLGLEVQFDVALGEMLDEINRLTGVLAQLRLVS